jgi:hypothetical protein
VTVFVTVSLGVEFGYPLDPYLVEHYYSNQMYNNSNELVSTTETSLLPQKTRQSRRTSADLDKKRIHKCSYQGTLTGNDS